MATMVVRVPPWQGEYELDEDRPFNTEEWRWIRQISGYMPLTVQDGFAGGDPTLFVALSVVAMHRNRKLADRDVLEVAGQLAKAPFDGEAITMVGETVEDDAVPPALTSLPAA